MLDKQIKILLGLLQPDYSLLLTPGDDSYLTTLMEGDDITDSSKVISNQFYIQVEHGTLLVRPTIVNIMKERFDMDIVLFKYINRLNIDILAWKAELSINKKKDL